MRAAALQRNIRFYYIYAFFAMFQLWAPIWVLFLLDRGFSLTEVTVLDMASFVIIALAEMPTGAVADRWGRKVSLGLGTALLPVSVVIFGLSHSFLLVLVSYLFWSIAFTLTSGADIAFLYDSIKGLGREAEFQRILGRVIAVGQVALAASAVLGGLLGSIDLALPVFVTAVALVPAFGAVMLFTEPGEEGAVRPTYLSNVRDTVKSAARVPPLRYVLAYAAFFGAAMFVVQVFFQPYLKERDIPVAAFGAMYMVFTLATVFGALLAHRLTSTLGERATFLLMPMVAAVSLALLGLFQSIATFILLLAVNLVYGASSPLLADFINRYTPTERRATMLSLRALLASLVLAPLEPGLGYIADRHRLRSGFFSLAAALALPIAVVLALWSRFERRADLARFTEDPEGEGDGSS